MKSFRYVLSCYDEGYYVFSVPLKSSGERIREILGRGNYPINGEPLKENEFEELSKEVAEGVEVGWHPNLSYFLEGQEGQA